MVTIMRLINFLVVIGVAAIPLVKKFEPNCYAKFYQEHLAPAEEYLLPAAAVLIALNLLVLIVRLLNFFSKQPDIEIMSNDEPCVVSLAAIEKRLLELAAKFPGVRQARVKLRIRNKTKPLACNLSFGLACDTNITGRIDDIKRCLHDAYNRLLPGTAGIEIITNVSELRAEEKPMAPEKKDYDETNFAGPIYPSAEHSDGDV